MNWGCGGWPVEVCQGNVDAKVCGVGCNLASRSRGLEGLRAAVEVCQGSVDAKVWGVGFSIVTELEGLRAAVEQCQGNVDAKKGQPHEETVQAWRAERAAAATELEALRAAVELCQGNVDAKAAAAEAAAARALQQVTALTVQRETLQETLDTLQRDNDMLVGKYTKKALELQNEDINLPDTVEELQEHCLKLREELIISALGREQAAAEAGGLRAQAASHAQQYHEQGARLAAATRQHLHARQQLERLEAEREQMRELGDKLHQANDRIEELLEDKEKHVLTIFSFVPPQQKRLHGEVSELRARISSLQQDLDNSEKVQQDFVRLSQSLQVQLERIREADTEVRWQHEDDVTECPACRAHLPSNKAKVTSVMCAIMNVTECPACPATRPR
ncbi:unnamed protein product [Plutella xylostella]|uniref:(diamondback moth) hypothetical protein n=1 Tax=Plutella xylostella TaxID=51655 RepID=A0A8S4GAK2_PLUXY|nr:unnamed protein product [Plutella xylostella]